MLHGKLYFSCIFFNKLLVARWRSHSLPILTFPSHYICKGLFPPPLRSNILVGSEPIIVSSCCSHQHTWWLIHVGSQVPSQVPLMRASLDMEAKSQLLSLKTPLKYGLYSLKHDHDYVMLNMIGLVLRVRSSFLLNPTLNTSPKPHLQKVFPCRPPCHTWNLGLGAFVKW